METWFRSLTGLALGMTIAGCGNSGEPSRSGSTTASGGESHASGGNTSGGNANGSGGKSSGGSGTLLRDQYPGDSGLANDESVLFFDDFENGWGRWDSPTTDTENLFVEEGQTAHAGTRYLRSTVTEAQLAENEYISASPRVAFPERTEVLFTRFHVRFPVIAPNPHHWVRFSAGTPGFSSSGLANTVPDGNEGFWFDFDANDDDLWNFYVYWFEMRSGRCNDGSATPGCEGDQGSTYHYGNVFRPLGQTAFPRDEWFCLEIEAHANTLGEPDGRLAFYVNDELAGEFGPGYPSGTWLRDSFHEGGCSFSACTEPVPFEGFDFRASSDVRFKEFFLDAYYERNTTANRRATLEARGLTVSNEQTILYDDIVIAKERIGCRTQ